MISSQQLMLSIKICGFRPGSMLLNFDHWTRTGVSSRYGIIVTYDYSLKHYFFKKKRHFRFIKCVDRFFSTMRITFRKCDCFKYKKIAEICIKFKTSTDITHRQGFEKIKMK